MTTRQRNVRDGGAAVAPAVALATNGQARPLAAPDHTLAVAWSWDAWFRDASDTQRHALLDLAQRQGVIYAHQVPPAANGAAPKTEPAPQADKLARWLAGHVEPPPPLAPIPLFLYDEALDLAQFEAVRRAVTTPDMCLIQGLPGTGKSRVTAEILLQAGLRGERVLFVARRPAALDVVLERVRQRSAVFALRHLDPQEQHEELAAEIQAMTVAQRRQHLHQDALRQVVQLHEEAERRCLSRRQQEPLWPPLKDLVLGWQENQSARQQIESRLAGLAEQIQGQEQGTSEFGRRLQSWREQFCQAQAKHEEERRRSADRFAGLERELVLLAQQEVALRPFAEAKRRRRWWTLTWWRALLRGDVLGQMHQLEEQRQKLHQQRHDAQEALRDREVRQHQWDVEVNCERQRLVEEEVHRQRQRLHQQNDDLLQAKTTWQAQWQSLTERLDASHRPLETTVAAVEQAFSSWQLDRRRDEDACQLVQQWQHYVEEAGPGLAARLLDHANVHALTWAALAAQPRSLPKDQLFDLLVVDEAETLTEADLLPLLRRARRWALIAEGPLAMGEESREGPSRTSSLTAASAKLSLFQRLWRVLHGPEAPPACTWKQVGAHLACCYLTISPEDLKFLESERLADAPDIELRILARPKVRPVLAQVVFPTAMTLAQAKKYIYREMQELAVAPASRSGWWREDGGRWHFQFAHARAGQAIAVDLEPGVCEWVTPQGATCSLEFAADADQGRDRAEAWIESHLRRRDLGRAVLLEVPYRLGNGLAPLIQDVLFPGYHAGAPCGRLEKSALEFVSVPTPRKEESRKGDNKAKSPPAAASWPKEGAGLEQDLTAPRSADRLPADLRGELPRTGLVNYLEAQAVIRKLEELASVKTKVMVLALYEAQVDLIRRLARRSEILRNAAPALAFGVPYDFAHQEASIVLVSLTRSHVHRAVPFGADSRELVLALTRARERLILFGDPGTLVKRSQWQGPLEHFDAATANLEAQRLARLVRCLASL